METRIREIINELLNVEEEMGEILYYLIVTVVAISFAYIIERLIQKLVLKWIKKLVVKTKTQNDEIFYNRKVFHWLAYYAFFTVLFVFSHLYGSYSTLIQKFLTMGIGIVTVVVIFKSLDAVNDIYENKEYSKGMPIKGLLSIIKIIIFVFALMIILVNFNSTGTALALLSSLGGMSAVIILVFRDSILGFVAGIQLSVNKILSIGDWIEMPNFDADGEVIEVSLTKVSIRNWDKTIVHIPAYKFIEESFINWEGMSKSGGRRIKRHILIDVNSIHFYTEQDISKLKEVEVLKDYLSEKDIEIKTFNEELKQKVTGNHDLNRRQLTNIGTFRAYINYYLINHPSIKNDYTLLVRQLEAEGDGLPLQIYCFTNDTRWAYFENIMSDIFDHLYAILPLFDLKVFQKPSGNDFNQKNNKY